MFANLLHLSALHKRFIQAAACAWKFKVPFSLFMEYVGAISDSGTRNRMAFLKD